MIADDGVRVAPGRMQNLDIGASIEPPERFSNVIILCKQSSPNFMEAFQQHENFSTVYQSREVVETWKNGGEAWSDLEKLLLLGVKVEVNKVLNDRILMVLHSNTHLLQIAFLEHFWRYFLSLRHQTIFPSRNKTYPNTQHILVLQGCLPRVMRFLSNIPVTEACL